MIRFESFVAVACCFDVFFSISDMNKFDLIGELVPFSFIFKNPKNEEIFNWLIGTHGLDPTIVERMSLFGVKEEDILDC